MFRHPVPNLPPRQGRPPATSRDELAAAALALFAERGFEETTLDEVAAAAGVSRRTLFRYFGSKNDIVWGAFDERLAGLRARLGAAGDDEPLMDVVRRAVVAFNDYAADDLPELRHRITLITSVPALQGHSMLRYADWCDAIAEFAARRLGVGARDHVPQVIATAALGTAMATFRHWIETPGADLREELDDAFALLATGFAEDAVQSAGRPASPR